MFTWLEVEPGLNAALMHTGVGMSVGPAIFYEQLAKDLLNRLTGERLDAQALSTARRCARIAMHRTQGRASLGRRAMRPVVACAWRTLRCAVKWVFRVC